MKKKIVFMLINMNIGGTEKALLNMISQIPEEDYEVTLLLLEEYGGFLNSVPKHVQVEYIKGYEILKKHLNVPPRHLALDFFYSGKVFNGFKIVFLHVLSRLLNDRSLVFSSLLKTIDPYEKQYDTAVAYAGPMDFISYFVINKIKAKRKVQWVHFDVTKTGFNTKFAAKLYNKFDKIFVVSNDGKNKLVKLVPEIKNKTETFLNIIIPESLEKLANNEQGFKDNYDGIRILTVGRLSKEKGQDIAIHALAKLKRDGYNVRWYCIGEGNARTEYEGLIKEYGVEEDFILLGSNSNPYPFIKQCDIYVQPSRHEGYCITLSEARYFHKPIVCTNFTGAREQIINKETGLIVNFNDEEMMKAIKDILVNPNLKAKLEKNTSLSDKEAKKDVGKLLNLIAGF